jgi:hypothetical protein
MTEFGAMTDSVETLEYVLDFAQIRLKDLASSIDPT